jgi:hypothetical protein
MQLRHVMSTALAALPAVLLTGCLSSTETGPRFTLNAAAVNAQREQVVQVLRTPVLMSIFDTAFTAPMSTRRAGGPVEALLARTGSLMSSRMSPRPSLSRQRATVSAMVAPGSWLPAEARGKTYVRVNGAYVVDSTRSAEAPANGVRIVLYERLADDSFGTTPIGYLDLADNSTGTKDIGTAKVVDGGGTTMATLTWTTETAGNSAGTYTVAGTLGTTGKQIVVGDTITYATDAFGKTTITPIYRSAAPFAKTEIVFATDAFNADSAPPPLQFGVFADGHAVYFVPGSTQQGSAVYIDGYGVAIYDRDAMPPYVSPSGAPLSQDLLSFILAASDLMVSLPLASIVGGDAMGMANRLSY